MRPDTAIPSPESSLPQPPIITENEIYQGDKSLLISRLAHYNQTQTPLPINILTAFYQRFATQKFLEVGTSIQIPKNSDFLNSIDHPGYQPMGISEPYNDERTSGFETYITLMDNEVSQILTTQPHTISAERFANPEPFESLSDPRYLSRQPKNYDFDSTFNELAKACHYLPDEQKAQICQIYIDQFITIPDELQEPDEFNLPMQRLISQINDPDLKSQLYNQIITHIQAHPTDNEYLLDYLVGVDLEGFIYTAIEQQTLNPNQATAIIAQAITRSQNPDTLGSQFARIANTLRKQITQLQQNPQKSSQLSSAEALARQLLGLNPDIPVHTALNQVYASLEDFGDYHKNIASQDRDEQKAQSHLSNQGRILSLACGTGRFLPFFSQQGYQHVVGVDISQANLDNARKHFQEQNIDSTKIDLTLGSWYELPFPAESFDDIECMGRSLTHTEDLNNLNRVIKEIHRVLKPNGKIIIDFPNPHKGEHQKNLNHVRQTITQLTDGKVATDDLWMVVDSPDNQNFYNRFTPPPELIIQSYTAQGFRLLTQENTEMFGGKDDENIYFAFEKIS